MNSEGDHHFSATLAGRNPFLGTYVQRVIMALRKAR